MAAIPQGRAPEEVAPEAVAVVVEMVEAVVAAEAVEEVVEVEAVEEVVVVAAAGEEAGAVVEPAVAAPQVLPTSITSSLWRRKTAALTIILAS
jgi:hypothetical protein